MATWLNSITATGTLIVSSAVQQTSLQIQGTNSDIGISIENAGSGGRNYQILSSKTGSGLGAGNFTIYDLTASTSRFQINSAGNVGMGATPLSTVRLFAQGADTGTTNYAFVLRDGSSSDMLRVRNDGACSIRAASWTSFSDARLKDNISSIKYGLAEILQMSPHKFDYINGQKNVFGFIAQEMQPIVPEIVEFIDDTMLGIRTGEIVPILVKAIQELSTKIGMLEQKTVHKQTS